MISMNKRIDNIGIFLQAVLTSATVISIITSIFIGPLSIVTNALIALILFTLCYNNYTIYKRKFLTPIYFLAGLAMTIAIVFEVFNGI